MMTAYNVPQCEERDGHGGHNCETGTCLRPPDQCVSSVDHRNSKLLWISVREQCEVPLVSNEIDLITLVAY